MTDHRHDFDVMVENVGRKAVRELLEQCTEAQQAFFKRLHSGKSIDEIPESKLRNAYDLCKRTLEKNTKKLVPHSRSQERRLKIQQGDE